MKSMVKDGEYQSGLPMPRSLVGNRPKLEKAIDNWITNLQ